MFFTTIYILKNLVIYELSFSSARQKVLQDKKCVLDLETFDILQLKNERTCNISFLLLGSNLHVVAFILSHLQNIAREGSERDVWCLSRYKREL